MSQSIDLTITTRRLMSIKEVIFHKPSTTIRWNDGTRTKGTCMKGDKYDEHVGFQAAVTKRVFGDHASYKRIIENGRRVEKQYVQSCGHSIADITSSNKKGVGTIYCGLCAQGK